MSRVPPARLYHLADMTNVPSIMTHGLLSTERLVALAGLQPDDHARHLMLQRPDNVTLANGITIRDQRPMPPHALARALDDGLTPSDWYRLLNAHVFLWPDEARMRRHLGACRDPQMVMTFDAVRLLQDIGERVFVTPINTGNARRQPARRGLSTLVPYHEWLRHGWPAGSNGAKRPASHPAAEFMVLGHVPVDPQYLVGAAPA